MKKIAVLIPVFNHIENTKKCIQTLDKLVSNSKFERSEFHIVVIDDGSTDGTSKWLKQHHPEVSVLKGDGNLWWSGGINLGANYSMSELKADFLLIWDNDVIPAADYFIELDHLLDTMDDRTIAGSKIFLYKENSENNENIIWCFGANFDPKKGNRNLIGYNEPDGEEYMHPRNVDWLTGMGTLVPVGIVSDIGLWDEKVFPQYFGDSDFTLRAKTAGYQNTVFPQLILWNDQTVTGLKHGDTLKGLILSLTDRRSNSNMKNNFQFYRRHSTSIVANRVLIGYYVRHIGGFFKWKILSVFGIRRTGGN